MSKAKISGLIISAGLSSRMKGFKPLAGYKGNTFIGNITNKLEPVCEYIIVVTGYNADKLKSAILKEFSSITSRLNFVQNELYRKGMFTSLQRGLQEAKDCDWVVYHFVDQPGLPEQFYSKFISQIDEKHNWVQPTVNEIKGHPILLQRKLFDLIISSSENSNLRELSSNTLIRKKYWECKCPEIFQDIDTEEEYLKLEGSR